jgi:hypothetical protein
MNEDGMRVFKGHTTAVFNGMRPTLSSPYYHKIMRLLQAMGCIEQAQRGARHVESIIYLHKKPELRDFHLLDPDALKDAKSEAFRLYVGITDQRLGILEERLGDLDIQATLADHEQRLQQLELQAKTHTHPDTSIQ